MPRARKHLVCLDDTPYYHVTSRCVRRAFLCGHDGASGESYEHRRGWIEDRLRILSALFSVHICAYTVMSNHYHLVVKIDADEPKTWSDDDVLRRWTALFKGPILIQRYRAGAPLSPVEMDSVRSSIRVFRARLSSLSWFMKCLNEPIARKANAEDGCTGHFWEARFHSQALRSEHALLAAMAYVDLNPVRAKAAKTPEDSEYTSIRTRLSSGDSSDVLKKAVRKSVESGGLNHGDVECRPLMPFADESATTDNVVPMTKRDYLTLVDVTGRVAVKRKRGRIDPKILPTLRRLGLTEHEWMSASTAFREYYRNGQLTLARTG